MKVYAVYAFERNLDGHGEYSKKYFIKLDSAQKYERELNETKKNNDEEERKELSNMDYWTEEKIKEKLDETGVEIKVIEVIED